ncbi:MAG: TraR/DksA C4-type zinc finger protein [Limnohabitans sp.]|jgi:DnaK suppressor protein
MNSTDRQDRTRARLLAARQDLLNRLRAQRGGIVSRADAAAEQLAAEREESHAQAITERDTAFALDAHETAELAALDAALERLNAGQYGLCTDCGVDIAPERLQAWPAALRCIACQTRAEAAH